MKKRKSLIAIVALLLVVAVGATLAYFQSSAVFENVFNTGTYKIVTTEVFESPSNWAPGQEIPKTITSTNEGTIPAAVRVSYTEQWLDDQNQDITNSITSGTAIINFDNTSDWVQEGNYYYYKYILEPGDTTSSFIRSVTLDSTINGVTCTGSGNTKTCTASNPALGATYKLTITKETVQADKYQDVWNTNVEITENQSNSNNTPEIIPSCTPKYFAFGDPTTSSTTNYTTINKVVMGALCEDGTKGVCIKKNNTLECFMQNNFPYERQHLRGLYPNMVCDGSSPFCVDDETTMTIKDDFQCSVGADGDVGCGKVYQTQGVVTCRTQNGVVTCRDTRS